MEKTLKLALSEYESLISDRNKLLSEVEKLTGLLKQSGRVVDLRVCSVREVITDYSRFGSFKYPLYEAIELTETEKVVNDLVLGMRSVIDDHVRTISRLELRCNSQSLDVTRLESEIKALRSRNLFQRIFNL